MNASSEIVNGYKVEAEAKLKGANLIETELSDLNLYNIDLSESKGIRSGREWR
jgi:uncharacterized protein YjbI with pentapeptide repeats